MARKLSADVLDDHRELDLRLQDGTSVLIPMRRHEEPDEKTGKTRIWWSADFSKIMDCDRCGGYSHQDTGAMSSSAGFIPALVNAPESTDRMGRKIEGGYKRVCGACSCVYGAYRNLMQKIAFVDDLVSREMRGLNAEEWAWLLMAATASDRDGKIEADYPTLAQRLPASAESLREKVLARCDQRSSYRTPIVEADLDFALPMV